MSNFFDLFHFKQPRRQQQGKRQLKSKLAFFKLTRNYFKLFNLSNVTELFGSLIHKNGVHVVLHKTSNFVI